LTEAAHFSKFRLNAGLEATQAGQTWSLLKSWPDAENIHELFTALPSKIQI
jgi:hypothetical protein